MKKIFTICMVSLIALSISFRANAQYGNYYHNSMGPGGMAWDIMMTNRINEISMQNTMMMANILNFYNGQAAMATQQLMNNPFQPMSGIITHDGAYITPDTVNEYSREEVKCDHCNNGYNYEKVYVGCGETKTIKKRCSYCHGSGKITKTIHH